MYYLMYDHTSHFWTIHVNSIWMRINIWTKKNFNLVFLNKKTWIIETDKSEVLKLKSSVEVYKSRYKSWYKSSCKYESLRLKSPPDFFIHGKFLYKKNQEENIILNDSYVNLENSNRRISFIFTVVILITLCQKFWLKIHLIHFKLDYVLFRYSFVEWRKLFCWLSVHRLIKFDLEFQKKQKTRFARKAAIIEYDFIIGLLLFRQKNH